MKEKVGGEYHAASDFLGEAMRRFRLAFELDEKTREQYKRLGVDVAATSPTGRWELPAPATFVIDRQGVIRYAFANWDYSKRASIEDVLKILRELKDG